jgi:hypothetical protein
VDDRDLDDDGVEGDKRIGTARVWKATGRFVSDKK